MLASVKAARNPVTATNAPKRETAGSCETATTARTVAADMATVNMLILSLIDAGSSFCMLSA